MPLTLAELEGLQAEAMADDVRAPSPKKAPLERPSCEAGVPPRAARRHRDGTRAVDGQVAVDFEKMTMWTEAEARTYFESGGEVEPGACGGFTCGSAPTGTTPWLKCLAMKPGFEPSASKNIGWVAGH